MAKAGINTAVIGKRGSGGQMHLQSSGTP